MRRTQNSTRFVLGFLPFGFFVGVGHDAATALHMQSDVLRLMTETLRFAEKHSDLTLVTMAMGELGKITRVASDSFGSSWTFASVGTTSAPGQLSLSEMLTIREIFQ